MIAALCHSVISGYCSLKILAIFVILSDFAEIFFQKKSNLEM